MLAKRHKAHLVGVYSVARSSLDRHSTYARGSAGAAVVRQQREADEQKVLAASRHFAELTQEYEISSEFRIVWRDSALDDGVFRALHCDRIVVAHPKPMDLPTSWSAARLLLGTGIQLLVRTN